MRASEYMERALDQEWHGTLGRREQEPPDAEETVRAIGRWRNRDADAYDYVRSEQALNPFGEDLDGALPPEELQDVAHAAYSRARPAAAPGIQPSSGMSGAAAPSSNENRASGTTRGS